MVRSMVDEFLEEDFRKPSKSHELYAMAVGETLIEKLSEESEVMRRILRGDTEQKILNYLKKKYPDAGFGRSDIRKFIERSRRLYKALEKRNDKWAKRQLLAREDLERKMFDILVLTENVIKEYHEKEDHKSTVQALKVYTNALSAAAKILGQNGREEPVRRDAIDMVPLDDIERAKRALQINYSIVDAEPPKKKPKHGDTTED